MALYIPLGAILWRHIFLWAPPYVTAVETRGNSSSAHPIPQSTDIHQKNPILGIKIYETILLAITLAARSWHPIP
ncbi:hypothetical protein EVAR_63667_1 [Eumeta japonica]|uniref:Uncharacterized protein n=1 Tax=Eumeta variegata TaxID=151549 RepID=A0A4C2ABL3_EUMVA|nr:hypothetical protein EVAR_63667_1 [Eumeta japonica]